MKISTVTGNQTYDAEAPRSTAYYYGDLERIKRQNDALPQNGGHARQNVELNEYVTRSEVINDGAVREVPPFRDRQFSLPEYSTPEGLKETYSTAGTFPMPEPKEKEPLLSELEIVGRLPLTQLETGVRRSSSWYLCCPNVGEEEISRESSWRYSSLRPVTAPPVPMAIRNGFNVSDPSQTSNQTDDIAALRAERLALSRALATERQRAARDHARLAELHAVIAELLRRKEKHGKIPEEQSDDCESTTQPAGELEKDTDASLTEQNDTCSLSPGISPDEKAAPDQDLTTETSTQVEEHVEYPEVDLVAASSSLRLSDKDSQLCLSTARCCQSARGAGSSPASCRRDPPVYTSPGRCEARQAKLASRVRLKKTEDEETSGDETWCIDAVERIAKDVCAQAEFREELVAAGHDGATLCRLAAQNASLRAALARAEHTQTRLQSSMTLQESACVCVCAALGAADRALECYDVLLALSEAREEGEREEAERVACQLLASLDEEPKVSVEAPLLPPGPWQVQLGRSSTTWSPAALARLRAHAAHLKAASVSLRRAAPDPKMYTAYDADDEECASLSNKLAVEMEEAVELEALLLAKESLANARLVAAAAPDRKQQGDSQRARSRRRSDQHQFDGHWLLAANETQL